MISRRSDVLIDRIATIVLPLVLIAGCGQHDPSDRLSEIDTSIQSWTRTLGLAAHEWTDGSVPAKYIRQVVDAAREAVEQQQKQLKKVHSSDAEVNPVHDHIQRLTERIDRLSSAIGSSDRDTARQIAKEIDQAAPEQAP